MVVSPVGHVQPSESVPSRFARRRIAVIGLAAVVHLAFCFLHHAEPAGDAAEHHALACSLAPPGTFGLAPCEGGPPEPTARRMPLYPLALAGLYAALGVEQGLSLAPVLQAGLMVLNVGMVIALARRFFRDGAALLAGVLTCFYHPCLLLPTELLSENLYLPLLLGTLCLLTRKTSRPVASQAIAFGLLGMLILTRANAVLLVPVAAAWAWRQKAGRRWWRGPLLTGCLILPLIPWWARNAAAFDEPVLLSTNGGWNFWLGHNPDYAARPGLGPGTDYAIFDRLRAAGLTEPQADRELFRRGWAFCCEHPGEVVVNTARKARVLFVTHTRPTWTFAGIALIAWGVWQRRRSAAAGLVAAGVAVWLGQMASGYREGLGLTGLGFSFGLAGLAAVAGLIVSARHLREQWLLIAVYAAQVVAGMLFIPLVRIRWGVDPIPLIYAAVGCTALRKTPNLQQQEAPRPPV